MARTVEIYCPKCRWRPRQEHRWSCVASCGCVWNTFDTGGVCPQCGKAWAETMCPACARWSPHRDWYHLSGEDPAKNQAVREQPAVIAPDEG